MTRHRTLDDHPQLIALTEAYRDAVLALGQDVVLSAVDGILTIRVALNTVPGFLGRGRS